MDLPNLSVISRDGLYRLLLECIKRKDLTVGRFAYSLIILAGLDSVIVLQDFLIRLFALCGQLEEANMVFDQVSTPTLYTWNAIISANTELAKPDRAFDLYHKMCQRHVEPNKFIFLSILRLCSSTNALEQGRIIHKQIQESGLLSDVIVGNTLIDMYIKCKSLDEARVVFDKLSRDVVSWSIMIAGYAHSDHAALAIELFLELQSECFMPNEVIFVCMAKLCDDIGVLQLMHSQIVEGGFEGAIIIANVLIDMYGNLHSCDEALKIFESLDECDVVSWGAIIAGLVHNGEGLRALEFFDQLLHEGVQPTNVIFTSTIKACSSLRNLQRGQVIHCQTVWNGLTSDVVLGNSLVDMYAKCNSIKEACHVFNGLSVRDDVSWGAMFSVYTEQGHYVAALELLERMHQEGMEPNKVVFMSILRACASSEAICHGRHVHNQIIVHRLQHEGLISSTLIDMYVKCGSLDEAQKVFDSSPSQDIVSWGALISGYAQHGHFFLAFELLQKLQLHGLKPDSFMFFSVLNSSDEVKAKEECRILHRQIIFWGYEKEVLLVNQLIHMYGNSGDVEDALKVFYDLSTPDNVSWRIMMAAYLNNGQALCGLKHCVRMCQAGWKMERIMLIYALKAVGILGDMCQGFSLHQHAVEDGVELDVVVGSTLIDMYANCGSMYDACEVFDKLPTHNTVSFGVMIAGYVQHGAGFAALELYDMMRLENIELTEATYLCCLKACGLEGALNLGRLIHKEVFLIEFKSVFFGSTLLDMYAKCGSLEDACRVFEDMSVRDAVSWEMMISIYAQHGDNHSALESFERMQHEGFIPRGPTYMCVLNACSDMGALGYARVIHDQVIRNGNTSELVVENAIIDCYARCGSMEEAHVLFERLPNRNVLSWSALIVGYSHLGDALSARQCLEAMEQEGMKLSEPLYTNILAACRHSGLLDEACHHFKRMKEIHRITPTAEHYNCLIDLLSRSGHLQEAESILKGMHLPPDIVAWRSLLTCFITFQDKEGSLRCFNEVSRLDPINGSAYALISHVCNTTPDQICISTSSAGSDDRSLLTKRNMSNRLCIHPSILQAEHTQHYTKGSQSRLYYEGHITLGIRYNVVQCDVSILFEVIVDTFLLLQG